MTAHSLSSKDLRKLADLMDIKQNGIQVGEKADEVYFHKKMLGKLVRGSLQIETTD